MWSAFVVGIWCVVQPWLVWPYLQAETSRRLTLVVCAIALGLLQCRRTATPVPLPKGLGWWVAALLLVLSVQHLHLIRDATYFQFFQETALFSDGLLDVVALTWGLWALCQLPLAWFRLLPWVGMGMLLVNGAFGVAQATGHAWSIGSGHPPAEWQQAWSVSGVMGLDRFLGAYAVAWVPVLWTWTPWTVALPLALVGVSGKVTAWIGAAIALCVLKPRWARLVIPVALVASVMFCDGELSKKLPLRLTTWHATLQATTEHPVLGWGTAPLIGPTARAQYHTPLPSFHSDWLGMALHLGWPMTLWAAFGVARLWRPPRTRWEAATRASLLALAAMSAGQAVVSSARMAGVGIVLLAWWIKERSESQREA